MVTCDESSEMPKCPLINSGIEERDSFPFNDNSSQIFSTQDSSFLCLVFPSIFFLYIYFFFERTIRRRGPFWSELKTVELSGALRVFPYWHSSTKNGQGGWKDGERLSGRGHQITLAWSWSGSLESIMTRQICCEWFNSVGWGMYEMEIRWNL